jgi:GT2 family glycosyltransferase
MTIELTIVAARRPALLARTLESFHERMFRHFEWLRAIVNIDPMWGDEKQSDECAEIVRKYFPAATIFTPENAGFTAAVKRVWTATKADFIFHLEDDWFLKEDVTPAILDHFKDPSTAQVSLVSKEKNWDRAQRGDFHHVKRRSTLFGAIKSPLRKKVPAFTTSPAFIRGDFARQWASLMDEKLDPEKQAYMGINPTLEDFVRPYRNYLYPGKLNEITIVDTGREWREAQNIDKKIIEGKSVWTPSPPG